MSDDDRADRLRRRRQRARDRAQEGPSADEGDSEETSETEEAVKEPETANSSETAKPSKAEGVVEANEAGEAEETSKTSETDESVEGDDSGSNGEANEASDEGESSVEVNSTEAERDDAGGEVPTTSVKDEQKPTYMYLPHDVRRNLDRAYTMLKADYEYEFDESFEKNRHFYPLVVSLGLDAMEELDAETVRERLEDVE